MPTQKIRPNYISTTGSSNGQVLTSNGTAVSWANSSGGGGGTSVTISDTAPVTPANGSVWWNSNTGYAFIYYNDGDSSQWVELSPRSNPQDITDQSLIINLTLGLV